VSIEDAVSAVVPAALGAAIPRNCRQAHRAAMRAHDLAAKPGTLLRLVGTKLRERISRLKRLAGARAPVAP